MGYDAESKIEHNKNSNNVRYQQLKSQIHALPASSDFWAFYAGDNPSEFTQAAYDFVSAIGHSSIQKQVLQNGLSDEKAPAISVGAVRMAVVVPFQSEDGAYQSDELLLSHTES